MFRKSLTVASFLSALGFGIVTLCLGLNIICFVGVFLSFAFLVATFFYIPSEDKKDQDVTIYGHPEGNVIKKN